MWISSSRALNEPKLLCASSLLRAIIGFVLVTSLTMTINEGALAQDSASSGTADQAINVSGVSASAHTVKTLKKKLKKATFTETTIGPTTIREQSPATNIQTILNLTPSINAYSEGPNGMRTTVQFRGFTGSQISETFDGIPLNDLFNAGSTNFASNRNAIPLTLGNISGIDIYRGINNPDVNSLFSLGGTINYLPKQPSDKYGVEVHVGAGSFSTRDYGATVNTGSLDGYKFLISAGKNTTHGWLQNTSDTNSNVYLAAEKDFNAGLSELNVYLIENHNQGYTPHNVPVALINEFGSDYQWPVNWSNSYNWDAHKIGIIDFKSALSKNTLFDIKTYYVGNTYNRVSYTNPAYIPEVNPLQPYFLPNEPENWAGQPQPNNSYDPVALFGSAYAGTQDHLYMDHSSSLGVMPQMRISLPHNTLIIGGNFLYGTLLSEECWYGSTPMPCVNLYNNAWNERDQRDFLETFIQDDIHILHDMLHITPGLKYTQVDTTDADNAGYYYAFGGTISNTEHYTSPSLGVSYAFTPHVIAYGSWGKTFKVPEISAYYSAIGVPNSQGQNVIPPLTLLPEFVTDKELGLRYVTKTILASVDVYREDFENQFQSYSPQTGQYAGLGVQFNGGTARYQGVEWSVENQFTRIWSAFANYTLNQANYGSFVDPFTQSAAPAAPVAYVPEKLANVGIRYGYGQGPVTADLYMRYTGPRHTSYFTNSLTSTFTLGGYTTLNAGGSYRFSLPGAVALKSLKLSLNIYNLLDKTYYNYAFVNQDVNNNSFIQGLIGMPRFVFVRLTAGF